MIDKKEIREWINTIVAILILVAMVIGLSQVKEVKEIVSKRVETDELIIPDEEGTGGLRIYRINDTHYRIGDLDLVVHNETCVGFRHKNGGGGLFSCT